MIRSESGINYHDCSQKQYFVTTEAPKLGIRSTDPECIADRLWKNWSRRCYNSTPDRRRIQWQVWFKTNHLLCQFTYTSKPLASCL